jgi:hypothetical protein
LLWTLRRSAVAAHLRRLSARGVTQRSRNHGIQGAGLLFIAFGVMGIVFAALLAYVIVRMHVLEAGIIGILYLLTAAGFLVRSSAHAFCGVRAARGAEPNGFHGDVNRYVTLGVVSVVLFTATAFITLVEVRQAPAMLILTFVCLGGLLLVWPLAVHGAAQRVAEQTLEEDDETSEVVFGRAPDGGLTAMGFLLLAWGSLSLPYLLGAVLGADRGEIIPSLTALPSGMVWLEGLATAATIWAGLEITLMTSRQRLATAVYGLVASVAVIVAAAKTFDLMFGSTLPRADDVPATIMFLGAIAVNLVIPLLALALAVRPPVHEPEAEVAVAASEEH